MKKCFFITPIGKEKSEERKRSDNLLVIIQEILELYQYEFIRADSYSKTGNITRQIVQLLIESELSIVDLTDPNPNVFYELGIRHSTGKAVIPIIEKGNPIPFDIGQERAIFYDLSSDKSVEEFKESIHRIIISAIKYHSENENPVSRLEDFIPLKSEPYTNEYKLISIINKLTKAYKFIDSFESYQKQPLGRQSYNMIRRITPLILDDLDGQLSNILSGTIETWGNLNNEIFELMMESVNDYFRAISVNDLKYWVSSEGKQYLEFLTNRISSFKIKAERIFVLEKFEDLLEKPLGSKQNYFQLVLLHQIDLGISIRLVLMENVKFINTVISDLDFGLFDDFAVSFFRLTEGRTHRVNFTKEQYHNHNKLYDKVKFKCVTNQNITKGDDKVFTTKKDIMDWYNIRVKKKN